MGSHGYAITCLELVLVFWLFVGWHGKRNLPLLVTYFKRCCGHSPKYQFGLGTQKDSNIFLLVLFGRPTSEIYMTGNTGLRIFFNRQLCLGD